MSVFVDPIEMTEVCPFSVVEFLLEMFVLEIFGMFENRWWYFLWNVLE